VDEIDGKREVIFDVLLGKDRLAGGDPADDRNWNDLLKGNFSLVSEDFQCARLARVASEVPFSFQSCKVAMHG
jgi:hypothetical protein